LVLITNVQHLDVDLFIDYNSHRFNSAQFLNVNTGMPWHYCPFSTYKKVLHNNILTYNDPAGQFPNGFSSLHKKLCSADIGAKAFSA
jgi:hypothetical protein